MHTNSVSFIFVTKQRRTNGNARLYSRTRCATKHVNSPADLACVKGMKDFRRNRSVRNMRNIIDIGIRIARSIKGFEGISDIRSKGVRAILSIAGHEEHQEHQRYQEHQGHQKHPAHQGHRRHQGHQGHTGHQKHHWHQEHQKHHFDHGALSNFFRRRFEPWEKIAAIFWRPPQWELCKWTPKRGHYMAALFLKVGFACVFFRGLETPGSHRQALILLPTDFGP